MFTKVFIFALLGTIFVSASPIINRETRDVSESQESPNWGEIVSGLIQQAQSLANEYGDKSREEIIGDLKTKAGHVIESIKQKLPELREHYEHLKSADQNDSDHQSSTEAEVYFRQIKEKAANAFKEGRGNINGKLQQWKEHAQKAVAAKQQQQEDENQVYLVNPDDEYRIRPIQEFE